MFVSPEFLASLFFIVILSRRDIVVLLAKECEGGAILTSENCSIKNRRLRDRNDFSPFFDVPSIGRVYFLMRF